jgi:hypothetical protein
MKILKSLGMFLGISLIGGVIIVPFTTSCSKKDKAETSLTLTYSQTSFTFTQNSSSSIDAPTLVDNDQSDATATFSCSPDLPEGLTLNTNGSITGIPSGFQTSTSYEITAHGTGL